jgi:hypothetical protein
MQKSRIDSLPTDLRAIAEDMLAVKFPDGHTQAHLTFYDDMLTTQSTSVASTLTEESLQTAMRMMNNHMSKEWLVPYPSHGMFMPERSQTAEESRPYGYYKEVYQNEMYKKILRERDMFSMMPPIYMGVDFGFNDE